MEVPKRLWKRRKLDTLLEELVTYYNSMSHGHAFYFKQFKEAFELFNTINDKELIPYEEETFLKYDEIYFLDNYFLHLIFWDLLTYNTYLFEPFNEKKHIEYLEK